MESAATGGVDGVLVIDKPEDLSSAQTVHRVKRIAGARKAGHAGTLDPFATGVLVCCLGRATRLARFFLHDAKRYRADLALGVETDTGDFTGDPVARGPVEGLPDSRIRLAVESFLGTLRQVPPAYSALKHRGVPLYRLARQGRPVTKPAREVTIHEIRVLEVDLPRVRFEVACSAGTYVRSLCRDIGLALGSRGHLAGLRRLESSGFSLEEAVSLPELEAERNRGRLGSRIISMADALRALPPVHAGREGAERIRTGRPVSEAVPDLPPAREAGYRKVLDAAGNLLAVIEADLERGGYRYCCTFAPAQGIGPGSGRKEG